MAFYLKIGDPDYVEGFDIIRKYKKREDRDKVLEKRLLESLSLWREYYTQNSFKNVFKKACADHHAAYFCWENNQQRKNKIFVGDEIPGTGGAKATFAAMLGNLHILAWEDNEQLGRFVCNYYVYNGEVVLKNHSNWEYLWQSGYDQMVDSIELEYIEKYMRAHFHLKGYKDLACSHKEWMNLGPDEVFKYTFFNLSSRKEEEE